MNFLRMIGVKKSDFACFRVDRVVLIAESWAYCIQPILFEIGNVRSESIQKLYITEPCCLHCDL